MNPKANFEFHPSKTGNSKNSGSGVKQGSNRGHDRKGVKVSPPIYRGDPCDPKPDTDTYTLTIRALPGWHTPVMVRLRSVLKAIGRGWGFKVLSIKPTNEMNDDGR